MVFFVEFLPKKHMDVILTPSVRVIWVNIPKFKFILDCSRYLFLYIYFCAFGYFVMRIIIVPL